MAQQIIYWDSCCFLGLLNSEQDEVRACQGAMKKAEAGELIIMTSAITFIEVIKMKGKPKVKKAMETTIQKFFANSFIYIRNVDREVGIKARDLMWRHGALQPKDSIHLATALLHKIPTLHTFDEYLLKLKDKAIANKIKICKPDIKYQMDFGDLDEQNQENKD